MRAARLITAAAVVVFSALTILAGWDILSAIWRANDVIARAQQGTAPVRSFSIPGLSPVRLAYESIERPGEIRQRGLLLELLNSSPLSGRNWLSYAGAQLASGEPAERIVAVLNMAAISGPNEGVQVVPRALTGILLWEYLPPERQISIAADLITAVRFNLWRNDRLFLHVLLRTKTDAVRQDIRRHVLLTEGASPEIAAYLGLPDSLGGSAPN